MDKSLETILTEAKATIAKNLVTARLAEKGLTQDALAKNAGLSRATVAQIESAQGDPVLSTIVKLADALNINPVLLLLTEEDIKAMAEVMQSTHGNAVQDKFSPDIVEKMKRLLQTGMPKNRERAVELGVAAAISAGLIAGTTSGAAIGTALFPGVGTIIGAALGGYLLRKTSVGDRLLNQLKDISGGPKKEKY